MATNIFPNSLSNDGVDKLNHKWMLLLMLLLALVSFIIPLHPLYNNSNDQPTSTAPLSPASAQNLKPVEMPKFTVVCWTPSQYTGAHVLYTTAYCTEKYNAAIRGEGNKGVYKLFVDGEMPLNPDDSDKVQPRTSDSQGDSSENDDDEKQYIGKDHRYSDLNKFKERVQKLVSFEGPLTLLLVAVCLGLSQIVWAFLSECVGSFNVGRTLEDVSCQSKSMDAAGRDQASGDDFESVAHSVAQSSSIESCLYLVKKILSIVFVLGLLLVLALCSLPRVDELQEDFDKFTTTHTEKFQNQSKSNDTQSRVTKSVNNKDNSPKHNDPFLCDMPIKSFVNIERYTIQCLPVQEKEMSTSKDKSSPSSNVQTAASPSAIVKNLLEFELLIFKIALALLVILLVSNIFSFLAWAYKLLSNSSRVSLGLQDTAAMDVVFLVQMARVNACARVAHQLARSSYGAKL